jgi:hypothetical protein
MEDQTMNNGQLSNGDDFNAALESPLQKAICTARAEMDKADDDLTRALQQYASFTELRAHANNASSPPTVVCFSDNDMCHAKLLVWMSTTLLNIEQRKHQDAMAFCRTMLDRNTWVECAGVFKDDAWQYDLKLTPPR